MSFASQVKKELAGRDIPSVCCARAELAGMVCFAARLGGGQVGLTTESSDVAGRFAALCNYLYKRSPTVSDSGRGLYKAALFGDEAVQFLRDLKLGTIPLHIDYSVTKKDCCKRAFAAGAFLGGGSVSDPSRGYHAEFVTRHFTLLEDFHQLLLALGIGPKMLNRKGSYVIYLKDSQQIEDLLAAIGAHRMMMEFVNVKIEKELRNDTNRMVNCDSANLSKTARASFQQRQAIAKLRANGLESLPEELAQLAQLREEQPDLSLAQLGQLLGLTKSGVNHRMRRILELAEELK